MSPYLNIPKHAPSRDFMVRQAVLNATAMTFIGMSPARALRAMDYEQYGSAFYLTRFFERVRREYRLLASRYSEAA